MAVTFTSVGFGIDDEEIDAAEWSTVIPKVGRAEYGVAGLADWAATRVVGERQLRIAPGVGYGYGVVDETVDEDILSFTSPGAGFRWDLVVAHRDWATGSQFQVIPGSSSAVIPARTHNPGNVDDQPLWLARVSASQVEELIDLRVRVGPGGAMAKHPLVLSYLEDPGTQVLIGENLWFRTVDSLDAAQLVSMPIGYKKDIPPLFRATFRRSDGALVLNAGQTAMKWQSVEANTIPGCSTSAGGSGAAVILPAGIYMMTVTARVAFGSTNWAYFAPIISGATVLEQTGMEIQTPPGFCEMSGMMVIHVATTATVVIPIQSNSAGNMRADGVLRIHRM